MARAKPAAPAREVFAVTPPPAVEAIIDRVIASWAKEGIYLNRRAIMGTSKTHVISIARFEIWWEIRQLPTRWGRPYSLTLIASWFKRKCHTTIVNGLAVHAKMLAEREAA